MEYTSLRLYDFNPQFFSSLGANTTIENKTINYTEITHNIIRDIKIVNDPNGKEISRTVTETKGADDVKKYSKDSSSTKVNPTLVIGFNQQIAGFESENLKLATGA